MTPLYDVIKRDQTLLTFGAFVRNVLKRQFFLLLGLQRNYIMVLGLPALLSPLRQSIIENKVNREKTRAKRWRKEAQVLMYCLSD